MSAVMFLAQGGERSTLIKMEDLTDKAPMPTTLATCVFKGTDAEGLAMICDMEARIDKRIQAANDLGTHLNPEQITILYTYLKSKPPAKEMNLMGLRALKNSVLNALRKQAHAPANFTTTLIEIYHDPAQDSAVHDYAIQHLISWYEQGARDSAGAKENIRAILQEVVQGKNSLAGTALLGQHRLSQLDAAFKQDEIQSSALKLAVSTDTESATRITAIQVCAERGIKEALPAIETIVQSSDNLPLQISSIGALGQLGGAEHGALLRRLEAGQNPALKTAIETARKRLLERRKDLF